MARIAFHAPLKPPDHPVPSGDRRIARLFLDALSLAGHEVRVASDLRSFEGKGDPARQAAIAAAGTTAAAGLLAGYRTGDWRPDLWFTYHLYHKAPDHLGPAVAAGLGIPYVVAEASYAPKRAGGPWDMGHRAVAAALSVADEVIFLNATDRPCVEPLLKAGAGTTDLLPFLDTAPFRSVGAHRALHRRTLVEGLGLNDRSAILLAVAMMRPGDKLASYRQLAAALATLAEIDWTLLVVGDGPARGEVEAAFAPFGARVRFLGDRSVEALPEIYAGADLLVWPAVGEAIGMAVLEAVCAGTPAVAGMAGSLDKIVRNGHSGRLSPLGDPVGFGRSVGELLTDRSALARMSAAALAQAPKHDLSHAAEVLKRMINNKVKDNPVSQIAFIRHGPTQWNVDGLIQGQSDIPLSDEGRAAVRDWCVPAALSAFDWVSSPLVRARETARLLGAPACTLEARLMEANWGDWEGRNLKDLRVELGEELARNEARGLDLTPPGGESPRDVRIRLAAWLTEVAPTRRPLVAVTHAGVLRAAYSLATGWDMKTDPPYHRGHGSAHLYDLSPEGRLTVRSLSIDLRADD